METMAAIIAAMMGAKPQVTQMTSQSAGGGGVKGGVSGGGAPSSMGLGRSSAGRPSKPTSQLPSLMPSYEQSPQEQGAPEVKVPYRPGMTPEDMEQAQEQAQWKPQDPDQLMKQWIDANQEVERLSNPSTPQEAWDARKAMPVAQEKKLWVENLINDYNSRQLAIKNQENADQVFDAAVSIVGKREAKNLSNHVLNFPDDTGKIMDNLMSASQVSRDRSAEQQREDYVESRDSAEMFNSLRHQYPHVDPSLLSAMVQTDSSMTENAAWLDGQRENVLEGNALETKDNMRRMDTYSSASRIVDQIAGIRSHIANEGVIGSTGGVGGTVRMLTDMITPPKDGVPGTLSSWTDAGALDRLVDPIISKIGLQTINQMRQMSETGGALGNVSNFEVQMVQAALASLNTGQDKTQFLDNLQIVETAFKRAAYLARNAPTMEAQAREAGVSSYEFMTRQLDELFPINPAFEREMQFVPPPGMVSRSPWESDGTLPMTVDPNQMINIPTDPDPARARTADEYMAELERRRKEAEEQNR